MCHSNLAIVGVQEARPLAPGAQILEGEDYRYLVLSGTATSRGTHGCQLWIDLRHEWFQDERKECIGPDDATILEYSPRHLRARVRTASLFFDIIVHHGP